MPAQPAPITSTSCAVSTATTLAERPGRCASLGGPAAATSGSTPANCSKFSRNMRGELARLRVVGGRIAPRSSAGRAAPCRRPGRRPAPRSRTPGRCASRRSRARPRARRRAARGSRGSASGDRRGRPGRRSSPCSRATPSAGARASFSPQQPRVDRRRLRQERPAEAGREHRRRLGDADLGAGEPRREAGEEVVARLGARQPRDRRHDAERVGGQEDDVRRVPAALRRQRVRDLRRGCRRRACSRSSRRCRGRARPFSSTTTFSSSVPNVAGRRVDLGLGLGREADHLRVAAALEVEDAGVAPAVLVVADQLPLAGRPRASSCRCRRDRRRSPRRPSSPTFAEQCIGKTPSSGSRSFSSVKIDFLISPA